MIGNLRGLARGNERADSDQTSVAQRQGWQKLARIQLGRSFSVTPKALGLVTHGLYSRIRHPMYVFIDVTMSGIALALERWWILLALLILLPLQIRNARRENKLLAESFGAEYQAWRDRTWL